jgi:putative DNA primase/helicase
MRDFKERIDQALAGDPLTEDAIALRFSERHKHDLRYVNERATWFKWDGARWCAEKTRLVFDLVRNDCRADGVEYGNGKPPKGVASAKTVAVVERLVSADRRQAAPAEGWDANIWSFNTDAGTVDLRTGGVCPHEAAALITKISGVAPDKSCATPLWDAFLARVTANEPELIGFLQRMAGYSLTGSTQEHALFFLYGIGANGKTTFLNALAACMGEYHKTAPIETFTAAALDRHPTDLAGLCAARLVTAVETEEGRRWAESKIKSLTGGDRISARFMRQDFFEYTPQFKLIIAGNHKPGLRSVDEAIRRRFNLIPFTVTIPLAERDPDLPQKLKAEYPGIMAWMIEGCLEWQRIGLTPPKIVTDATAAYLEGEDAVAAWIDEAGQRDPNAWQTSSELYASWAAWAQKSGEHAGSLKRFLSVFEAKGFVPERHMTGRGFRGLRLFPTC